MLYSKSTRGFYLPEIHGDGIPDDAVHISEEQYRSLLQAQADGKHIVGGLGGFPVAQDPVLTITDLRNVKIAEIESARDIALRGGFAYAGQRYDSDTESIQRINGAVTLSLLNPDFETPWITEDNSLVNLDAAALAGLGAAAGQHEAAQIFKARGLKDAVLAASTEAEIAAIAW